MPRDEKSKEIKKRESNKEKVNSQKKTKNDNHEIQEDIAEALDDMPPKMRRSITMAMMQTSTRDNIGHPLFEKFTEEHIDKFLDYTQKDDENEYKYKSSNRLFYLIYAILIIALFIFLIAFLLPHDKDLLNDIFKLIVAFLGGLGSGYGLKSRRT
ncbi:hypothetical protein GF407_03820 [candidate division KSB1 bacterium]|nr:hypothetical protein [candidate division KSB1 bacterium]